MFLLGTIGGLLLAFIVWSIGYKLVDNSGGIGNLAIKISLRFALGGSVIVVIVFTGLVVVGNIFGNATAAIQFQLGVLSTYLSGVAAYFIYRYRISPHRRHN